MREAIAGGDGRKRAARVFGWALGEVIEEIMMEVAREELGGNGQAGPTKLRKRRY